MAIEKNINILQNNADFAQAAKRLYGEACDVTREAERYGALATGHQQLFGHGKGMFFSSPGRIELCGNHTDHQNGKVLCASINLDTLAIVTPTDSPIIRIKSGAYPMLTVDTRDTRKEAKEEGTSLALIKGVCQYYVQHGYKVGGLDATMTSNVARGSGVSSSASFECCVAEILNVLYNEGKISAVEKAKASQYAEYHYFGKPCGLLDQCAIALGGVAYIDFADTHNPIVRKLDWRIDDGIVLVNTGGDHCKLTDCYAAIRDEMTAVAKVMGGKVLREVPYTPDMPIKCREAGLSGRAVLRAVHYYKENERVDKAVAALNGGDAAALEDILNASGYSSMNYLQNLYVPGDDKQPIPWAIEYAKTLGAKAARVHGGGFAGTILALYAKDDCNKAVAALEAVYGAQNVFYVCIRPDGAVYTGICV